MKICALSLIIAFVSMLNIGEAAKAENYLGKLSTNPYAKDSTSNPYGAYGNPYSSKSATNPYATQAPRLYVLSDPDSISNPYGK